MDRNPDYRAKTKDANVFKDCTDCTLNALNILATRDVPAGLILENCARMNITNCTIRRCQNGGILLQNVKQSRVSDCLITEGEKNFAIRVSGGQEIQITDNLVSGDIDVGPGTEVSNTMTVY
ncbi:MAG: right-handed parallel beta-helix repeat-containing protein, partial [Gimesia chilikensis]